VAPNKDDFMLLATTIGLGASGRDILRRGEPELEGDATFGGGNVLPGAFGAVVDLVGWVDRKVVARGGIRRWRLDWLHGWVRFVMKVVVGRMKCGGLCEEIGRELGSLMVDLNK
jgi:hypothetical protein